MNLKEYKGYYKSEPTTGGKEEIVINAIYSAISYIGYAGEKIIKKDPLLAIIEADKEFQKFANSINSINDGFQEVYPEAIRDAIVDARTTHGTKIVFDSLGWDFGKHFYNNNGRVCTDADMQQDGFIKIDNPMMCGAH